MSSNTVYLITGASRGMGKGLASVYLARPQMTVIAALRDPTDANTQALSSLPTGDGSKLLVVGLDSTDEHAPATAIQALQTKHGISKLDVVIANAGLLKDFSTLAEVPLAAVQQHMMINGYAVVLLFQACLPLLAQSQAPKFVAVSTFLASIGGMGEDFPPMAAYGMSKVVALWAMRKAHFENPNVIAFGVDPGWVQTEMGNDGAHSVGMKEAPLSIMESVNKQVEIIDGATREKTSGHFPSVNGGDFAF